MKTFSAASRQLDAFLSASITKCVLLLWHLLHWNYWFACLSSLVNCKALTSNNCLTHCSTPNPLPNLAQYIAHSRLLGVLLYKWITEQSNKKNNPRSFIPFFFFVSMVNHKIHVRWLTTQKLSGLVHASGTITNSFLSHFSRYMSFKDNGWFLFSTWCFSAFSKSSLIYLLIHTKSVTWQKSGNLKESLKEVCLQIWLDSL